MQASKLTTVYIDFQGGSHGNYLEFVCNKFLAQVPCNDSPFNTLGASHNKQYFGKKIFKARHYFQDTEFTNANIISIRITPDDLLPLSSVSLLRAGDLNLDIDQLEVDTYNKINIDNYKWVLDNLIHSFFQTQIQDSYNAVKDPSWPSVSCMDDFDQLPEWIRLECLQQHNLKLLQLDERTPDCPRYILREFFKIGFQKPELAGFITQQQKMIYDQTNRVHLFPFGSFYNTHQFIDQVQLIGQWAGFELQDVSRLIELHTTFLNKQPYKNSKQVCDDLIQRIVQEEIFDLPKLDLMQESYVLARLETHYGHALPVDQITWFANSQQILDCFQRAG